MKQYYCLFFVLFLTVNNYGQSSIKKLLKKHNTESIPYLSIDSLLQKSDVILLDTREEIEYNTSHLKGAICVGYDLFNIESITSKIENKNAEIIVYCSIGIRSEDIGEKLKAAGYTNVKNLYGGIFEWKNKNNPIYDANDNETNKVHTHSKYWSRLLTNAEKIN
ncbi:rhodanese-like domain-containing protein [Cellulophaga sp. F20128]|uniref:rhodanese-like domain-containing protein n=1 Tax=Cellulophaga sp. F20128 TaxID=2926413 RepID=UPI001FF11D9E|nr:rhodanese-like domain-containing protein [Cellulophaga sp. F20128]MCK0157365.1 rhodanese-like domain-containing protein [Cellulophaga sp. F20128]